MPRAQDHAERVHPTLILLVLSLAGLSYAILSSARHTISVDPKMAARVQANPSPRAVHLLR